MLAWEESASIDWAREVRGMRSMPRTRIPLANMAETMASSPQLSSSPMKSPPARMAATSSPSGRRTLSSRSTS